jgi:hypothetical protein
MDSHGFGKCYLSKSGKSWSNYWMYVANKQHIYIFMVN